MPYVSLGTEERRREFFSDDGLHPTPAGYDKIARLLFDAIVMKPSLGEEALGGQKAANSSDVKILGEERGGLVLQDLRPIRVLAFGDSLTQGLLRNSLKAEFHPYADVLRQRLQVWLPKAQVRGGTPMMMRGTEPTAVHRALAFHPFACTGG